MGYGLLYYKRQAARPDRVQWRKIPNQYPCPSYLPVQRSIVGTSRARAPHTLPYLYNKLVSSTEQLLSKSVHQFGHYIAESARRNVNMLNTLGAVIVLLALLVLPILESTRLPAAAAAGAGAAPTGATSGRRRRVDGDGEHADRGQHVVLTDGKGQFHHIRTHYYGGRPISAATRNHNGGAAAALAAYRSKYTDSDVRVLYQIGQSESDLPECRARAICSKVDFYETPWLERQCVCPKGNDCPATLAADDGYTIADKTRQYKMCEPIKKLPKCRYFRDVTWKLIITPNNATEQIVHCHCPKNSVTYLVKRQPYHDGDGGTRYQYSFACSPQSRLRCQRKEPCRLFTVRKRMEFLDEVNTNTLCQCPQNHRCPHHHTDYGVIAGKPYAEDLVRTYSGFCLPY